METGKTSSGPCPPVKSFEDLLRLDARDPRRRHLDDCPRCRARLIAFRSFLERRPLPAGVDLGDARRRLSAAIRAEAERESHHPHQAPPRFPRFWRMQILWKPALGLVAAGVLIALLLRPAHHSPAHHSPDVHSPDVHSPDVHSPTDHSPAGGSLVLRGQPSASVPLVADWAPDRSVRLSWPAVPSADGYRVMLYGTDLEEIARLEAGRDTVLALTAAQVARLGPSGGAVFWRVATLAGGEPVSLSAPATLQLP